jgi:putative DNA methylase
MAKKYRASKFKAVKALTHTPPYKIHRYFARRPWNLFEELIRYYSEPGQVILDPFAGGGVTAYEGLKNNRKVVACDINPLSNYIVKNMYFTGDVTKLDNAVNLVIAFARQISKPTFEVKCPHCALATQAGWYELAHVVECTDCASEVLLVESAKVRNGVYRCSNNACWNSKRGFAVARAKRNTPAYLSIHGRCENCKEKFGIKIDSSSIDLNRENTAKLKKNVIANGLELADEVVPMDWDRQKEDLLFEKGIITFQDLFTKKNLYTNYLLPGYLLNSAR